MVILDSIRYASHHYCSTTQFIRVLGFGFWEVLGDLRIKNKIGMTYFGELVSQNMESIHPQYFLREDRGRWGCVYTLSASSGEPTV